LTHEALCKLKASKVIGFVLDYDFICEARNDNLDGDIPFVNPSNRVQQEQALSNPLRQLDPVPKIKTLWNAGGSRLQQS
jgi:hypothetical protein